MIHWALLLHFYQPPTQIPSVLRRICDESYRPLLRVLRDHPRARVTVNVCGCLAEMLHDHGHADVIEGLRALAERGQVELTGTAKFHPILPLIPPTEARHQIVQNRKTNKFFFGPGAGGPGFFPPELACSSDSLTVIAETGHRWVLLSGIACSGPWPLDVIHTARTDEDELALVFRDDVLSNGVSFRSLDAPAFLVQLLTLRGDRTDVYAVTAMDAETFGHHHPGLETSFLATLYDALERGALPPGEGLPPGRAELPTRLADALGQGEIVTTGISELLDRFPRGAELVPQVSSWSTTADDLVAGNPFPLWSDPGNPLHRLQWEHTRLCIDLVQRAEQVAHQDGSRQLAEISRALLDRGLHSCQYWWGSRRPMWEPHMVHRGLMLQQEAALSAYRAIRASPAAEATKAESYYRVAAARDLANRLLDHLLET